MVVLFLSSISAGSIFGLPVPIIRWLQLGLFLVTVWVSTSEGFRADKLTVLDVCRVAVPSTCGNCTYPNGSSFSYHHELAWCKQPKYCFTLDSTENGVTCAQLCSGGYVLEGQQDLCEEANEGWVGAIVIFILFPLCFACGCCHIFVTRCRNAARNKIRHGMMEEAARPIPLLQVYVSTASGGGLAYHHEDGAVIAHAAVAVDAGDSAENEQHGSGPVPQAQPVSGWYDP